MGMLIMGALGLYLAVVGAPGLVLGILSVVDKGLRASPRDAMVAAVLALASCAAILVTLWQIEVAPALQAGRMSATGPIMTLWGWHVPAMLLAMLAGYLAGQKKPMFLGICIGVATAGWIWFLLAVGFLADYLQGQGVQLTH